MYPVSTCALAVLTEVRRRTAEGFVEATFHIPEDIMRALKMKAVQENKRFSKVAEDAFRQYLRLPKEEETTTTKKKRSGTKA